jgi:uncharacterized membrane protein
VTRFEEKVSASLAGFVVALVPYAFTMLLVTDVPATTRDIVMVLVGVIAANATQAVQHRFGSNPASQRKDEIIAVQADTANKAQAALAPVLGAAADTVEIKPGETATVTATRP